MFKPHSKRHAASTAAFKASIPLDDILKKAGWSSAKTFRRFYFRHVVDETVELLMYHIDPVSFLFVGNCQ